MLAGCAKDTRPALGKLVPVQGKITMPDGKPLSHGRVSFVPIDMQPGVPTPTPEGNIEEDGSYTLSTYDKPGAPPGKYRVVLHPGADRKLRFAIPQQYFSNRQSPLEVEVVENKEGGYDLKLEARKGNPRGKKGNPPGKGNPPDKGRSSP
jgi:hypothetical protein